MPAPDQSRGAGGGGGGMFGNVMQSVYGQSVTGLTGLLAGVKNLLPADTALPLTRFTAQLMANKPGDQDPFAYFDPKAKSAQRVRAGQQGRQPAPFKDALVFVMGGGNYAEYQNLLVNSSPSPLSDDARHTHTHTHHTHTHTTLGRTPATARPYRHHPPCFVRLALLGWRVFC